MISSGGIVVSSVASHTHTKTIRTLVSLATFRHIKAASSKVDLSSKGLPKPPEPARQPTPPPSASTPFDDLSMLDLSFPESHWATSQELLSLDWSQFQDDLMLPLGNLNGQPTLFGANEY